MFAYQCRGNVACLLNIDIVLISLQSPSAILFVNSTNIRDNSFDAIVYDLNRPEFTANMSIYGYFANEKPKKWKSTIA